MRGVIPSSVALAAFCLTVMLRADAGNSTVADAAQAGDNATVRTLLKQAADVNAAQGDGMTPLHWAAMKNDPDLPQTPLYPSPNVKATTPLGGYPPPIPPAHQRHPQRMAPRRKA